MKHTFTAIKQKIAHKKDEFLHDDSYEGCQERFLVHFEAAKKFQTQLSDYVRSVTVLATACGTFGTEIAAYYTSVSQGPTKVGTLAQKVLSEMETTTSSNLNEDFTSKIMNEWNEYVGLLNTLNKKIPERKQCLTNFDYYKIKVRDLQAAQDAKQTAGKEVPEKDKEALTRNQEKLSAAERAYNEINAELLKVFQLVCDDSANALNQLMLEVVETLNQIFGGLASSVGKLSAITQNPGEYECGRKEPAYYRLKETYGATQPETVGGGMFRIASKFKRSTSVATPRGSVGDDSPAPTPHMNEPPPSAVALHSHHAEPQQAHHHDDLAAEEPAIHVQQVQEAVAVDDKELRAGRRVRGLYSFEGSNEDELTFQVGEEMTLVELFEDGWWTVVNDRGGRGIVPYNYVEVI